MNQHLGIYTSNLFKKEEMIEGLLAGTFLSEKIQTKGLSGELFSSIRIKKLIDLEDRHGFSEVTAKGEKILAKMSSGEQKKALLNYLLKQQCDFIVLDDAFGNLDKASQAALREQMASMAEKVIFIQIFHLRVDVLPFIDTVLSLEGKQVKEENRNTFLATQEETVTFSRPLPPSITPFPELGNPLIAFNKVSVSYEGRKILHEIEWQINKGDFWQLVGPNGSGKSTMITMISGDNPKAFGQDLVLFGRKKGTGENVWQIKKQIGYFTPSMTQQFTRLDSVEKMILGGFFDSVGLYIKPTELQTRLAQDWLHFLEMYDLRNKPFDFLTLGQQRMVLIARAMVKHPPLLILDEPTTGLDDHNMALFTALVNKIAAESKTAILYVSHRTELGLKPKAIFELTPSENGSTGSVIIN
jgi:molybdate transport system ATP-binding protein